MLGLDHNKLLDAYAPKAHEPAKTKPVGLKLDDGKLAYDLLDDDAEAEMVAVLTFGAVKYEPGNWAHVEGAARRYFSAVRRHLRASRKGEVLDPETGLLTLAHVACCVHFLLALELRRRPELAASLPERLKGALEVARRIRAGREAKAGASGRPDGMKKPRKTKPRKKK